MGSNQSARHHGASEHQPGQSPAVLVAYHPGSSENLACLNLVGWFKYSTISESSTWMTPKRLTKDCTQFRPEKSRTSLVIRRLPRNLAESEMSPWKLHIHPQQSWGHGETTLHSSAQTRGWIKTWKYQIFEGSHSPPWVTLWAPKNWVPALLRLTTSAKVVFSLGLTSEVSAGDLAKTGAKLIGKWGKWLLNEPLGYENGCRFIF